MVTHAHAHSAHLHAGLWDEGLDASRPVVLAKALPQRLLARMQHKARRVVDAGCASEGGTNDAQSGAWQG